MKKKITNYFLLLAIAIVGLSSFVSCKDYESDDTVSMKEQLRDIIIKQAGDVSNLASQLQALEGKVGNTDQLAGKTLAEVLADVNATASAAKATANKNDAQLKALFGETSNLNEAVSQLKCVTDLSNKVLTLEKTLNGGDGVEGLIDKVSNISNGLTTLRNGWTGNLKDLSDEAAKALALAKEDSARIDQLKNDHQDSITEINKQISLLNGKYDNLQLDVNAAKADAAAAKKQADSLFNETKRLIDSANQVAMAHINDTLAVTKQELENAFKAADEALSEKIDSLDAALNSLLNKLSDRMYKMVTGVIIQGTENYVTGSVNTPFDISSNVLAAFYGSNKTGVNVTFPMGAGPGYSSCYVRPEEATGFTPLIAGEAVLAADATAMYEESDVYGGNAGRLYVTVNPSSADMSGLQCSLVDTRDDAAAGYGTFTLNKCNDRQMKFGWTRSAETNGFYVANANVVDPQAAKADVNVETLKNVAKDVLNKVTKSGTSRLSIAEAVSTVYKELNNKLVAYAVKIPGTYVDSLGVEHERNIYSQYKLAATAVKPLSYATLKDGLSKQIPMLPTLESKGIIIDMDQFKWTPISEMDSIEVTVELDSYPDINNITINGNPGVDVDVTQPTAVITKVYKHKTTGARLEIVGNNLPAGTDLNEYYLVDVTVTVNDADVELGNFDFSGVKVTIGTKTETMKVKVPMDEFNAMIRDINDQVGGMLDNVTSVAEKLNNAVQSVDNYINRMNSYIQKINNKLRNINSLLQITLMYETSNGGYAQVNAVNSASAATQMSLNGKTEGAILLKPTSYTAEMFAPALKKYVAVTSAPSAAAQNFANAGENMNKVLDGRCREVMFQANQPGLYEITYSAVDFYGYITTRKFYINVE